MKPKSAYQVKNHHQEGCQGQHRNQERTASEAIYRCSIAVGRASSTIIPTLRNAVKLESHRSIPNDKIATHLSDVRTSRTKPSNPRKASFAVILLWPASQPYWTIPIRFKDTKKPPCWVEIFISVLQLSCAQYISTRHDWQSAKGGRIKCRR